MPLFRDGELVGAISVGIDDDGQRLVPDELEALQALSDGWSKGDDLALLSAIYEAYRRRALGLAFRLLRDRDLAEEMVQDVFRQSGDRVRSTTRRRVRSPRGC